VKYTLLRLDKSKRWHIVSLDERFTVCEKRIYTVDMYATNQTPENGEKVCVECDAKKIRHPKDESVSFKKS
jgi:hypothetical protein